MDLVPLSGLTPTICVDLILWCTTSSVLTLTLWVGPHPLTRNSWLTPHLLQFQSRSSSPYPWLRKSTAPCVWKGRPSATTLFRALLRSVTWLPQHGSSSRLTEDGGGRKCHQPDRYRSLITHM